MAVIECMVVDRHHTFTAEVADTTLILLKSLQNQNKIEETRKKIVVGSAYTTDTGNRMIQLEAAAWPQWSEL